MMMKHLLSCTKTGEKTFKKPSAVSQAWLALLTALPFKVFKVFFFFFPWWPSVTSVTSPRPQRALKLWLSTLLGMSFDPLISFHCYTLIFWLVIRWPGLGPGCEKPFLPFFSPTHTRALYQTQPLANRPCPCVSKPPLTFEHVALNGNRSPPVLFSNAQLKSVPAQVGQNHAQRIRKLIKSQASSLAHQTRLSIQLPNHLAVILFALILKSLSL